MQFGDNYRGFDIFMGRRSGDYYSRRVRRQAGSTAPDNATHTPETGHQGIREADQATIDAWQTQEIQRINQRMEELLRD